MHWVHLLYLGCLPDCLTQSFRGESCPGRNQDGSSTVLFTGQILAHHSNALLSCGVRRPVLTNFIYLNPVTAAHVLFQSSRRCGTAISLTQSYPPLTPHIAINPPPPPPPSGVPPLLPFLCALPQWAQTHMSLPSFLLITPAVL